MATFVCVPVPWVREPRPGTDSLQHALWRLPGQGVGLHCVVSLCVCTGGLASLSFRAGLCGGMSLHGDSVWESPVPLGAPWGHFSAHTWPAWLLTPTDLASPMSQMGQQRPWGQMRLVSSQSCGSEAGGNTLAARPEPVQSTSRICTSPPPAQCLAHGRCSYDVTK